MGEEKDNPHEVVLRVMSMVFSQNDLERRTSRFEAMIIGLDLKSLPEYQEAIRAIEKYRKAALEHFDSEYQRRLSTQ